MFEGNARAGIAARGPGRKSIAVLLDQLDHQIGGYEELLRAALESECVRLDLNQYFVVGRAVDPDDPKTRAHNSVYDLVGPLCVDGVVVVSGGLSNRGGARVIQRLCEQLRPLPLCSLGLEIPGVPSIVAEGRGAMQTLVQHLVLAHGLRDFAFVGGPEENPDSKLRKEVFVDVLRGHGLPVHEQLVVGGMFTQAGGEEAVYALVGTGRPFDAIVCANDAMALGALEALRALGHHVPRDIVLTGFDDVVQSRISSPAVTTVRQPLDQMAALAIRIVFEQMSGNRVAERSVLPCEFVPRKSCGCGGLAIERSIQPMGVLSSDPAEFVSAISGRLVRLLERAVRVHRNVYADWAAPLVESLILELRGQKELFLSTLEELLDRTAVRNDIYEDFQEAITLLRDELSSIISPALEALWHDARRLIAVSNTRAHVRQRVELDIAYARLLRSGEQFSTALTAEHLKAILTEEFPGMDIRNAFIFRYIVDDRAFLESFCCLRGGKRFEAEFSKCAANTLLRLAAVLDDQRRNWFVLPLTFESEPLGVAVLEFGSGLTVYEMLREQISAALKNIALHAEIVQKTALHERSVQERLAATDRMRALSVLAGGVAHDLNNALGPLVALPDVILAELLSVFQKYGIDAPAISDDLAVMKAASLRAARTIKDLLTLGRQGHAAKEHLDVNLAIETWFSSETPRRNSAADSRVQVTLELSPTPMIILASEPHVVRAISNLVRNAIEALNGSGSVRIKTYDRQLLEGLSGFEPIDAGDYVVVAVSDDGKGIIGEDLPRVFEPFFSKKRLDDTSGSGLGLAIVHGVVKEHGGFVDVHSQHGKGTEFFLYFPHAHQLIKQPDSVRAVSLPSVKVLVVDDDPVQLRTATRVLSRQGHQVEVVDSGAKAFSMMLAWDGMQNGRDDSGGNFAPFDVVVMDMQLNEAEDGLTIFQKMRARYPSLRGIIASGHSPTDRTLLAVSGGLTWLAKPYTADELAESVRQALSAPLHVPTDR